LRFPGFDGEWIKNSLGDICKMQAGKFVSASDIYEFQNSSLYPCFGGNGLRGFTKSYNQDGIYSLIGRQGALCGNVTLAKGKFHATEHAVVVYPNDNLDSIWAYYLLNYLNLNNYATGMAQPGLSVQNLEKVSTSIPNTIDEQRHIAKFLSLIDERIKTQNKIIEQLESLIKALKADLLNGAYRFKNEREELFPKWEQKQVMEIAFKKASNISANTLEDEEGEFKIYGATGVLKQISYFKEEQPYISIVKDGAGVGRLFLCEEKTSVLGTLEILKNYPGVDLQFLYYLLSEIDFSKYVTGSTIPHIYFKNYSTEKVNVPCLSEQKRISAFLSSIDDKIELERNLLIEYLSKKKYLLNSLLT